MLATVNTDASFSPQYNVGGYAFWISSNLFKKRTSGPLQGSIRCSTDAEMRCILNALTWIYRDQRITRIIVNTDSMNSIQCLTEQTTYRSSYDYHSKEWIHIRKVYSKIKQTLRARKVKIEFRHVKAHSGVNDARSFVNEWCDAQAKNHMRNQVSKIKSKNNATKN